jgi:hypothetical protein
MKVYLSGLHLTKACSSLRQLMGQALGSPQHIPSPHKWAQGRLQAETLDAIPMLVFYLSLEKKMLGNWHLSY